MQCVIVVDDNADVSRVLVRLLEYQGYRSESFASGEAVLEYLRRRPVDLVILDVMMPGMDGIEVLRRIRKDPKLAGMRVVMFSAVCDERLQRRAMELGADDYWVKGTLDFIAITQRLTAVLPGDDTHRQSYAPRY
jgi:CheY-like chemotaxis protein